MVALLLVLSVTGVALAHGRRAGSVDPSFGKGGRVVVDLPPSRSPSWFGPIAPTAAGGLLVAYNVSAEVEGEATVVERRRSDGAFDSSFGNRGKVRVRGSVTALAEDPLGGVIYGTYGTIGRLLPDGSEDKAFDRRNPTGGNYAPVTIASDGAGRIVVGGEVSTSARYHAHEGEAAVRRFEPDGSPDKTFASGGTLYMGPFGSKGGELGLLPDGSILILGNVGVEHVSADGTVLPTPKVSTKEEESASSLVVFGDGSFATATSPLFKPGCKVVRYRPDGSVDPGFGQAGEFVDPGLSGCHLQAAPAGGLLVRGRTKGADGEGGREGEGTPELLLLDAAGTLESAFGKGGSLSIPPPTSAAPGEAWSLEGVAFLAGGRLVLAGGGGIYYAGGGSATLVGLTPTGQADPAFGAGGTVSEPALPPSWTSPRATVAMPDGELIVTGVTDSGNDTRRPFWMRFGPDGGLRRTRNGAAFVSTRRPASVLEPAGSGQVYALMYDSGSVVAKLGVGGVPVRGFGEGGSARLPHEFRAASFVIDPGGGVTVVGHERESGRMAAYRLTPKGLPDRRFGRDGLVQVGVRGARHGTAKAAELLPGGDVAVLGSVEGKRFGAVRLAPDGHLRRTFGRDGLVACGCGGVDPSRVSAVLHRGGIYVLDHGIGADGEQSDLLKLDLGGRLDRAFAGRGWRPVQIGESVVDLLARGRRLLAVGQEGFFTGPSTVRAFAFDGKEDRSFEARAAVSAGGNRGSARLVAALQPDGRLVLVGEQRQKKEREGSRLELLGLR